MTARRRPASLNVVQAAHRAGLQPVAARASYTEYRPPADLAPWIACFWRMTGDGSATIMHRVLPDGCADLLFNLELARTAGRTSGTVVGPMSAAQLVGLQGQIDLLGVRLLPGVVGAFSGIPAGHLLDEVVPIPDLPILNVSMAQLAEVAEWPVRLGLLIDACRARVRAAEAPDPAVRHAITRWMRAERSESGVISVLARDLRLSERAFERRFVANAGLTPVGYRRLARFRSVLRLHAQGLRDWAALAAMTGYSDQSHFVRDCCAFTGLTPTRWAATQADTAGFLQDGKITTF